MDHRGMGSFMSGSLRWAAIIGRAASAGRAALVGCALGGAAVGCAADSASTPPLAGGAAGASNPAQIPPRASAATQAQLPASAAARTETGVATGTDSAAMETSGSVMGAGAPGVVTYHADVRPVLEHACVECHGGDEADRIAPFSLDSWPSVSAAVMNWDVVGAIESGRMPPWMPADDCRPIADNRALGPETRALLTAWKQAGYPEGDASQYVAPAARGATALGEPTLVLNVPAPYTPRVDDEYTCFGLADASGAMFVASEERYLTAIQVLPGEPSEVHHVQVHRTEGAASAGPTNCSGFIAGSAENMFSWRPGSTPLVYPSGSAARIPAGNGFLVQIHYNAAFALEGRQPDQTRVAFWLMEEGAPESLISRVQVFGPVNIPAGAAEVISTGSATVDGASEIVGITPHAHMLATKMSATANIGGQDECLIDIPKWDYHWQGDYLFEQPLAAPGGARITATCVWDNTAENQPIVNMMQLQPRNVSFGEGSFEEMCLHYIWLRSALR
jgi:hypothetical protein